jgi:putative transposase
MARKESKCHRITEFHPAASLNRQRSVFPSSQALLKALYLATFEATKKWTMPIRNWGKVRGELAIMYPDRIPE